MNKMSDIIYKQTGERTKLLRFPGGSSIRKEIMPTLTKDVLDKGYQYFDWNVSSGDGAAEGTTEGVLARVTEGCALHDVNVVLQHDSKKWSLDAVEEIMEMVPLSEDLKKVKAERDEEIKKIFTGESDKFVVIIGPCSADDEDSVCDYVNRLAKVNEKVKDKLFIVPRIYTNKPRTTGEYIYFDL